MSHIQEIFRQYSIEQLNQGLQKSESIIYSVNGNRSRNSKNLIRKLQKILPALGITRVADISFLSTANYPVFQSCRPNLYLHSSTGQNSGAQGKGPTKDQALVSCLMESMEQFCAEPRNPHLMRASYEFLQNHYLVADPQRFTTVLGPKQKILQASTTEDLMWTQAFSLRLQEKIWIPAETVYFPFLPLQYRTRSLFPSGSNGLASGSTYLEAIVHALYEVIERHYHDLLICGDAQVEAFFEEDLLDLEVGVVAQDMLDEFELQVYAIEMVQRKNLPMIMSVLTGPTGNYLGFGCSGNIQISVQRSISEVMQSCAIAISGAREDLGLVDETKVSTDFSNVTAHTIFSKTVQPENTSLSLSAYRKRVYNKDFKTLNQELDFLLKFLTSIGHPDVYVSNLTRVGVDIPVVKVVVPTLRVPPDSRVLAWRTVDHVIEKAFPKRPGRQ